MGFRYKAASYFKDITLQYEEVFSLSSKRIIPIYNIVNKNIFSVAVTSTVHFKRLSLNLTVFVGQCQSNF